MTAKRGSRRRLSASGSLDGERFVALMLAVRSILGDDVEDVDVYLPSTREMRRREVIQLRESMSAEKVARRLEMDVRQVNRIMAAHRKARAA